MSIEETGIALGGDMNWGDISLKAHAAPVEGRRSRTNTAGSHGAAGVPHRSAPFSAPTHSSPPHPSPLHSSPLPTHGPFIVEARNMPFKATQDEVGDLFFNAGCNVSSVTINMREGRADGTAHVELADRASLEKAVHLAGSDFGGRRLDVRPYDPEREAKRGPRRHDDGKERRGFRDARPGDRDRDRERDRDRTGPRRGPAPREDAEAGARRGDAAKPEEAAPVAAEPTQRKKLQLAPRSTTAASSEATPSTATSSIFGTGRPQDIREIEKRKTVDTPAEAVKTVAPTESTAATAEASAPRSTAAPRGGRSKFGGAKEPRKERAKKAAAPVKMEETKPGVTSNDNLFAALSLGDESEASDAE